MWTHTINTLVFEKTGRWKGTVLRWKKAIFNLSHSRNDRDKFRHCKDINVPLPEGIITLKTVGFILPPLHQRGCKVLTFSLLHYVGRSST